MQVTKLALFPILGLNDVYRRSYKVHVTNDAINQLDQVTRGGSLITQPAISKVATSIMAPSAEVSGMTSIVNGWREQRYRFILEVVEQDTFGCRSNAYYIGYTDYGKEGVAYGAGNVAHLDPQMTFYVTSVHRLRGISTQGNLVRTQLSEASQYIFHDGSQVNVLNGETGLMRMRPVEVFQSQSGLALMNSLGFLESNTYDFTGSTVMSGETSARRNNSSGTYLYDLFKAANEGYHEQRENGEAPGAHLATAISALDHTSTMFSDPFWSYMSQYATDVNATGRFNYKQLCTAFPMVDSLTTIFDNSVSRAHQWDYSNTAYWNGSDMATVIAANIAQAVPTIMLENMIADLRIDVTNLTPTNQFTYQFTVAHGLAEGIQLDSLLNRVAQRIIDEIAMPYSNGGLIPLNFTVDASIYGETMVNISFDNGQLTPYVMPTFADNGASPIITSDKEHFTRTMHDLYTLTNDILGHNAQDPISLDTNLTPTGSSATFQTQPPGQMKNYY